MLIMRSKNGKRDDYGKRDRVKTVIRIYSVVEVN